MFGSRYFCFTDGRDFGAAQQSGGHVQGNRLQPRHLTRPHIPDVCSVSGRLRRLRDRFTLLSCRVPVCLAICARLNKCPVWTGAPFRFVSFHSKQQSNVIHVDCTTYSAAADSFECILRMEQRHMMPSRSMRLLHACGASHETIAHMLYQSCSRWASAHAMNRY